MAIEGVTGTEADLELDKGLRKGALGLWSTVNLGLASTAPAYSLAATLGYVVIAVGVYAPVVMLLAFVPMWLTAVAYRELNEVVPDCGTTFTWAAKAFGPRTGWMGGWGVAVAGIIFMTSAAEVSANYFYSLIGVPGATGNRMVMLATGSAFVAIMTWVTYRGIQGAAKLQYAMVGLQVLSLGLLSVVSLVAVITGSGEPGVSLTPEIGWLNPLGIESWSAFVQGFLLCLFIYWGFDTTLAVNEETDDATKTPGRAAVISTILLMVIYVTVALAALSYLGVDRLSSPQNANDIFAVWAQPVLGEFGAKLLAFTVLVSAISSMMTTILPTARGTLAMAVYRAIPARFAVVHPKYMTPSFSTLMMGVVSIALFVGLSLISANVLQDAVTSTSLAIAFYYGLTGWSAVWFFRRQSFGHGLKPLFNKFVFPLLGALILTYALVQSAVDSLNPDYGNTTIWGIGGVFVIGIGSLALGVVLMIITNAFMPAYFQGKTLQHDTPVLVPDE
jgi:amino acid transporter